MSYSFTEKKRIRMNFGKMADALEVPYLLAIQVESYRKFLQLDVQKEARKDLGLQSAFRSVFPVLSYSGNAALEFVEYNNQFMEKIMLSVPDIIVTDILKEFYYLADPPFIVQNVRSNDNKYLLTKNM